MNNIIVGITGDSGVIYAKRLVEYLVKKKKNIHLTITGHGADVIERELQTVVDLVNFEPEELFACPSDTIFYHNFKSSPENLFTKNNAIEAMVIVPCSMSVVGELASGMGRNLVGYAGSDILRQKRKLIIVPRETPLSVIDLENMTKLAHAGASILPASPSFAYQPLEINDMVDFVVSRILDQLGIENEFNARLNE